jgi:hypothetical protein
MPSQALHFKFESAHKRALLRLQQEVRLSARTNSHEARHSREFRVEAARTPWLVCDTRLQSLGFRHRRRLRLAEAIALARQVGQFFGLLP